MEADNSPRKLRFLVWFIVTHVPEQANQPFPLEPLAMDPSELVDWINANIEESLSFDKEHMRKVLEEYKTFLAST